MSPHTASSTPSPRRLWPALLAVPLAIAMVSQLPAHSTPPAETGPVAHASPGTDFDAERGGEPFYTEEQLATNGEAGWLNYRIPALTVTNDGDLLASYDGRPTAADSPGPNSILQRRSTDNGATWGPQTLIREGRTEEPIEGYSDPSYIVDRETGTIFNFHVFSMDVGFGNSQPGTDPEDRNVIHANVASSSDNGQTWTHRTITVDITDDEAWRSRFASAGQGIQLRYGTHAGRLIQQYTIINDDAGTFQAVSIYSDDHGETWQAGEPVGVGMDENKTVELSDGRVMLNSRDSSGSGYRKIAISTDGGHSYGEVSLDEQLPDPTNNASIVRAFPNAEQGSADAQVLLFSNAGSTSGRENGTVRMSCDDGQTWPVSRVFQPGGMAYSTLITQPDGTIGLLYEPDAGFGGIRYANFNLAWLGELCVGVSATDIAVDAGTSTDVEVTVANQTAEPVTDARVSLEVPEGWQTESTTVGTIDAGSGASAAIPVTVPADAIPGGYTMPITLETDQGSTSGSLTISVNPDEDALLTVIPTHTNPQEPGSYEVGDVLEFSFRIGNVSDDVVTVAPRGNLSGFDPDDGAPNCRWQNLPVGAEYTCTTGHHVLTEGDLDAGEFTVSSVWSVLQGNADGPLLGEHELNHPTVALVDPLVVDPVLALDAHELRAGEDLSISGSGFTSDGEVDIELHSDPVSLTNVTATADGRFEATVTIPEDTDAGDHTLVAIDVESGTDATIALTVLAADEGDIEDGDGGAGDREEGNGTDTDTDGTGDGGPGAEPGAEAGLPATGSSGLLVLMVSLGLVLTGAAMVWLRRRNAVSA